jgi:UTP--glucose-1-phosphate uridylyltransferase
MIELDEMTTSTLKRFRFEPLVFERMREDILSGVNKEGSERLVGTVTSPAEEDLVALPSHDSNEGKALADCGRAALVRGEVGVIVLAGGMATRFGGVVKAVVEVVPGYSFLDLKLANIQAVASSVGCSIPVGLLTSFSTTDEIKRAVRDMLHPKTLIEILEQSVTMRLTGEGQIFNDASGRPSLCATGHGDLLPTLRASGALHRFRQAGGRMLMVSNVDNLAASLDPRVIGAHCRSGKCVTVEVVRKEPGDRGGIPAYVDGQLQIVEEFRLPLGFDSSQVPFFNTNTFVLDAEAIDRHFDLDWFFVRRSVDGQETIQSERLLGQVTAFLPTQFLIVERHGLHGRFLPAKDREELQLRMPKIQALMDVQGISLAPHRGDSSEIP